MHPDHAPGQNRVTRTARFYNHLHRYVTVLRRRWWILPTAMAMAVGIKGYLLYTAPPLFVSVGQMTVSAKLQIPAGTVYSEEVSQFLGTQVAFMKSSTVLMRAAERVRSMRPNMTYSPVRLQVSVLPKTTIFNLQAFGSDPDYARAYLDAVMEEYMSFKREMRTGVSDNTLAGITEKLVPLERDLKKLDNELIDYQASNSVVYLNEQGKGADGYLAKLNQQQAALKTEFQLLTLLDLDQNLERQAKAEPGETASTGGTDAASQVTLLSSGYLKAKQDVQLMKAELREWSAFLKPKHPKIIKLAEDIDRQERLLEIFRQQGVDQLENRRNSVALQITNLDREIKEWEVKSLDISRKMAEYERIRANKQRVQTVYDRLLAAMQTLGVDKDISQESVAIIQKASPAEPANLGAVKGLIIASALGLIAGVGLLLMIERFDDRATTFTDLQDMFDEPILGQIPKVDTRNKNDPLALLQSGDDRHAFFEAYRNVRSSLLYMETEGTRPKTLLVTSAIPSDGKSMTTANLAITMALAGSRVLLVDADLRRGLLHKRFNLDMNDGFTGALKRSTPWKQSVLKTSTQNLNLLPCGRGAADPSEMFLAQTTLDLIKEMESEYDYVVFDTAPVMAADDVTSLAPLVNGVIFVIRANYTSARVARAALDLLYQRKVDVLGMVFNAVEANTSEYYYYKYKDYYSKPVAD